MQNIGKTIQYLRRRRGIGQSSLAQALGVTMQAVSKWETGRTNPDLCLLPPLAKYFGVSIDRLFAAPQEDEKLPEETAQQLEMNGRSWTQITETGWQGTFLPSYGNFTPDESQLRLLGDVHGRTVLEIGCGCGESLCWLHGQGAKELWGLDISAERIAKARELMEASGWQGRLYTAPMETDPGIPHRYFDLVFSVYGLGWTSNLDKTTALISEYLKPGGQVVFSWDNPLLQCIDAQEGHYLLSRSYVEEREIDITKKGARLHLRNWKLSSYLNCLASHGFFIEQLVEESAYDPAKAEIFLEGKYYSAGLARLINSAIIIKARKI